ncbi:hypothetical protein Leryth_018316 [Lithospermum erythrorhizon]|nr:hypothetical protein Leryth_018316 [Lithospermum erythrorhizon]
MKKGREFEKQFMHQSIKREPALPSVEQSSHLESDMLKESEMSKAERTTLGYRFHTVIFLKKRIWMIKELLKERICLMKDLCLHQVSYNSVSYKLKLNYTGTCIFAERVVMYLGISRWIEKQPFEQQWY